VPSYQCILYCSTKARLVGLIYLPRKTPMGARCEIGGRSRPIAGDRYKEVRRRLDVAGGRAAPRILRSAGPLCMAR